MSWHLTVALGLALIPIVLSPGTSAILTAQYAAAGGRRDVVAVMFGTCTGLCMHACLAALGLSALITASVTALMTVKVIGAVYLIGLGCHLLVKKPPQTDTPAKTSGRNVFLQALFGNIANPKAVLVYLTLPVQFLQPGESAAAAAFLLAVLHIVMLVPWLGLWALVVGSARRSRRLKTVTAHVQRGGGLLLIGLGVRSMLTR
ncbi:MAG TPA: LysE family translocator [Candidatus Stackebrandtia excrementipullorum]|nr:LysE family translocator [Candidatus Stackebrandtia excrementipullorum]